MFLTTGEVGLAAVAVTAGAALLQTLFQSRRAVRQHETERADEERRTIREDRLRWIEAKRDAYEMFIAAVMTYAITLTSYRLRWNPDRVALAAAEADIRRARATVELLGPRVVSLAAGATAALLAVLLDEIEADETSAEQIEKTTREAYASYDRFVRHAKEDLGVSVPPG